jgi:hypothetical protein
MGDEVVFHQLFVSRIAMFAFFLVSLSVVIYEGLVPVWTPSRVPVEEIVFWGAGGVGLLWLSWRNWRAGVRLTSSEVHIMGIFRDRRIAREQVVDVTSLGQLVWVAPRMTSMCPSWSRFQISPAGSRGWSASTISERLHGCGKSSLALP